MLGSTPEKRLWAAIGDLFDEDDGSLPEIVLGGLAPGDTRAVLDFLLRHAPTDVFAGQHVWHEGVQADVAAADHLELVAAEGRMSFAGLVYDSVALPYIGAWFHPDHVALDYEMGEHWNPRTLGAFMRLVLELSRWLPHAQVVAAPDGYAWGMRDLEDPRFPAALDAYAEALR